MASVLYEGWDKYGPPGIVYPAPSTTLPQGGWNISGSGGTGVPANEVGLGIPLSTSGAALYLFPSTGIFSTTVNLSKTLPNNFSRLIAGVRFNVNFPNNTGTAGIVFYDNGTAQCSIMIRPLSGFIAICQGNNGTVLQTSVASVAYNTTHYLEMDITFNTGASGAWAIYLDGVQILNGSGTTRQSANNFANVLQFTAIASANDNTLAIFDDLYIFDTTTAFNNSVLLSNPTVVTQFGISDHQTQFTNNGNVVGNTTSATNTTYNLGANAIYLEPFTPNVNCTLNAINILPRTTNAGANFKGVIYTDNSGIPNTLLSSGTQITGSVNSTLMTLPLITPQSLTNGTQYWIGFINDSAINFQEFNGALGGSAASNSYAGGAPSSAPAMTPNQASLLLYGLCSGAATNWESEALNPPIGDVSSILSNVATTEDLYVFPIVPVTATIVYGVGVSGNSKLTFSGAHTIDLMISSGGTPSAGSLPNQAQTINPAWYNSYNDTDPNTSVAWTISAVNTAFYGMKIAT